MPKTIEVWSFPKCEKCRAIKARLIEAGFAVKEGDLAAVQHGDLRDVEVLTQFTMQNGYAPVIRVKREGDDEFVLPDRLEQLLIGKEEV